MEDQNNNSQIDELKTYLKEKFKKEEQDDRPLELNDHEKQVFMSYVLVPFLKKLKTELAHFKFDKIVIDHHKNLAKIKFVEYLSAFIFKISISNIKRKVIIYYEIKYKTKRKQKYFLVPNLEKVEVSYDDIKTINNDFLMTLFNKWMMSKDELIEKDKVKTS